MLSVTRFANDWVKSLWEDYMLLPEESFLEKIVKSSDDCPVLVSCELLLQC